MIKLLLISALLININRNVDVAHKFVIVREDYIVFIFKPLRG